MKAARRRWLQRVVLRTASGPLRPVWALVHRSTISAVAIWMTASAKGSRVYLKGGFGFGKPIYGLSDVDMIVVAGRDPRSPGAERRKLEQRWERLVDRFPTVGELFQLWLYENSDLRRLEDATYLTYDLSRLPRQGPALLGHGAPHDPMGLLEHPGLFGPQRDWRQVRPRARAGERPPDPVEDPASQAICAWLELRFVWGFAFQTVGDPGRPSAAQTCQKLVADSARIWLWLRFGERLFAREQVLARALHQMPEEEDVLRSAIELGRELPRRPEPPLAEVLPFLVRTSAKIAGWLRSASGPSATDVKLLWGGRDELLLTDGAGERADELGSGQQPLLPLADWRARAVPGVLDVMMTVVPGDPGDPSRLAELMAAGDDSFFPALRSDRLLVLPTSDAWFQGRLRGIECATTDPVSVALAGGATTASFPDLRGWSASDCAQRALAEHRAWLELSCRAERDELPWWARGAAHPELTELCGLFTAARAALFAETIADDAPELPLTAAAIAKRAAERLPAARTAVEAAYESLADCRGNLRPPDPRPVKELRRAVATLPAYVDERHASRATGIN